MTAAEAAFIGGLAGGLVGLALGFAGRGRAEEQALALAFARAQTRGVPRGTRLVRATELHATLPRVGWKVEDVGIVEQMTALSTYRRGIRILRGGAAGVTLTHWGPLDAARLHELAETVRVIDEVPVTGRIGQIYALGAPRRITAAEAQVEKDADNPDAVFYRLTGAFIAVRGLRLTAPSGASQCIKIGRTPVNPGRPFWRWAYKQGWGEAMATWVAKEAAKEAAAKR